MCYFIMRLTERSFAHHPALLLRRTPYSPNTHPLCEANLGLGEGGPCSDRPTGVAGSSEWDWVFDSHMSLRSLVSCAIQVCSVQGTHSPAPHWAWQTVGTQARARRGMAFMFSIECM